jgi:hypothetical protein
MDHSIEIDPLLSQAVEEGVRIATINYPVILRPLPLDHLAHATGGPYYTVQEQRYNIATSYVSTYFKLANVMFSIATQFYQGSLQGMPLEVQCKHVSSLECTYFSNVFFAILCLSSILMSIYF